ncbi:MAG: YhcB family protein [Cellvibrionales bacterium]|nr:YhcB family protein [Cellvibrionales bacterium]
MESLHMLIVTGICCFLAGGIIGAFFTSRYSANEKKNRDLEKHLHESQTELKQYRQEVTEHFMTTSNLLNNLTETYRDIHNHLADSASKLTSSGGTNNPLIQSIPEPVSKLASPTEEIEATPPLDYAPKSSPYDKGSLTEDHHLEKVELGEKPIDDLAQAIADNAKPNA